MVRSSEWWPLSKLILSLSPKRTLVSSREWLFPGLHATTRPWTGAPGATGRGTDSSFIKSTCVFFGDFQWSNSFPKLDGWVNFYMSIDRCVVRAKLCHDSLAVATSTYQSLRPIFMCRAHVVQSLSWVFGYAYKYHVYIIFCILYIYSSWWTNMGKALQCGTDAGVVGVLQALLCSRCTL